MSDIDDFIPIARPLIGVAERHAVDRVLRSGMLAQGTEVAAFEAEFSARFGLDRVGIAVNSGTSALHLGLLAAGVRPGDEVIVPSFTFSATANAIALTGATPIFADIDPLTFCLDPASVAERVSERTIGILPVHLYGHPADMPALERIADAAGLQIFEDAAQAPGAALDGTPVGAFGVFGAFSFYPTKNLTSGEGGLVTVARPEIERLVRLFRNQGMARPYGNEVVGFNYRMTDIHAAIGRVQLRRIEDWTRQRRANAAFLTRHLAGIVPPSIAPGARHVFNQYAVRIPEDRDGFAAALRSEHRIGTGLFYETPVHRLAPFAAGADLPATDRAARECLTLPVHPSLSPWELERIVVAVNSLARAGAMP